MKTLLRLLILSVLAAPASGFGQTQTQYYTVPSIAALKAMTTSRPQIVQVNDANPGVFNLTIGACAAADDIFQVQPTAGTTVCYTRVATPYSVGKSATANGVLSTNGSGVPSISTTLPSGLTQDSPTFTGTVTSGATTKLKSIVETVTTAPITANVLTIDLSSGATIYTTTSNANITTFTILNAPAGATAFTLVMTGNNSTYTQAWGASVYWPNGVPPSITTETGKRDVITFITTNGGADWLASITQNF